nr:hypothetical protein [Deltaproteobacteria bacterium]
NQSRRAAEHSTQRAQTAAALAEDRLTASLVAQGRRELNDNRAMPALAYFGEAMRRGADSPALRFMVAVGSRAWRYQLVAQSGGMMTSVAASAKNTWLATADQDARIHFWNRDGTVRTVLATEVGWISQLSRMRDDRMIAVGRDGILVIDPAAQKVLHRIKLASNALGANHGPGADEVSSIEEDAIRVYGFDGAVRRKLEIPNGMASSIPVFDPTGRYVSNGANGDVSTIDLVAMKRTTIAKDIEGILVGSSDGAFLGYVDKVGIAHVHTGDGKPLRTFKPENPGHSLVFSDTGYRVGVLGEHELVIHDANGKATHGMSVKSQLAQYAIRGDETWIADHEGVLRHYREGYLLASLPNHLGEVRYMFLSGDLVTTLGGDGSMVMTKSNAAQLDVVPRPCKESSFAGEGIATTYQCGEEHHVYVGRTELGVLKDHAYGHIAMHRDSKRGAVAGKELVVFDADKKVIAKATEPTGHLGAIAFEDADHLLVAEPEDRHGIFRWTIGTERWAQVTALKGIAAITVGVGGVFGGTIDGHVVVVRDGKEVSRVNVGGRVAYMTASGDRRWVAATLVDGGTAIIDGQTGALVRRLEPADALVTAASLDQTGDLILRSGRGTQTVWDRATGEALVFDLDLLGDMQNAVWSADGRIELTGRQIGILDIPRDLRSTDEIVRDISCKVPLRVRDGKLEPSAPECSASR